MSCKEYWEGNPFLVRDYYQAHLLRNEQKNQEMWLQGYYNFIAYSTALSNLRLDGKKRKPNNYISEPLQLAAQTEKQKKEQEEKERSKIIASLSAWKINWDKANKKEQ